MDRDFHVTRPEGERAEADFGAPHYTLPPIYEAETVRNRRCEHGIEGYGSCPLCTADILGQLGAAANDDRPALPEDDAQRGLYPMAEGCLDYFPNALAEVSRISYAGNQKHNPGEPMHWSRGKSTDHRNKIIRHTADSRPDTEGAIEHAAQAAWRALALLQEKIERVRGVPMARGARPAS